MVSSKDSINRFILVVWRALFSLDAHNVAVMSLHLSKKNNPLFICIFTFLKSFLLRIFNFYQYFCLIVSECNNKRNSLLNWALFLSRHFRLKEKKNLNKLVKFHIFKFNRFSTSRYHHFKLLCSQGKGIFLNFKWLNS